MFKSNLNIILILASLLINGCAGVSTIQLKESNRESISGVYINQNITMPEHVFYQGPAQSFGYIGGIIGAVAVEAGASNKSLMQKKLKESNIDQAIATVFTHEFQKSNKLPFINNKDISNAELSFEVVTYGLGQTQGFSKTLYPTLGVNSILKNKTGEIIWQRYEYITPLNKKNNIGHDAKTYYDNPKLLIDTFRNAAQILSQMFIKNL